MHSALYFGRVRHRRYGARPHAFDYGVYMVYLDLAEVEQVFAGRWLWSTKRAAIAWFRREDHFGDCNRPLEVCVRELVQRECGVYPAGPVRLLTHLRYFGYVQNPISVYYCFDECGERVEHVVLEVTNTPWGERHCYVVRPERDARGRMVADFQKCLHVSPFMEMDYCYHGVMSEPGAVLSVHLENRRGEAKAFDATLGMHRKPITGSTLAVALAAYPLMTVKVVAAIYFEALRLWWKGVPYVPHRKHLITDEANAITSEAMQP